MMLSSITLILCIALLLLVLLMEVSNAHSNDWARSSDRRTLLLVVIFALGFMLVGHFGILGELWL